MPLSKGVLWDEYGRPSFLSFKFEDIMMLDPPKRRISLSTLSLDLAMVGLLFHDPNLEETGLCVLGHPMGQLRGDAVIILTVYKNSSTISAS